MAGLLDDLGPYARDQGGDALADPVGAQQGAVAAEARARGARWLHVGFEPRLASFCDGCGFRAAAGPMAL